MNGINKYQNEKIFLLRNEGYLFFQDIRKKTSTEREEYDLKFKELSTFFVDNLQKILTEYLKKSYPNLIIGIYDLVDIEKKKKALISERPVITLDSYSQIDGANKLGVSRLFKLKGEEKITIGARPGYPNLEVQINNLKKKLSLKEKYYLVDDDIFSGGTMEFMSKKLHKEGFNISGGIVGLSVGSPTALTIPVKSVYAFTEEQAIDIADPRDFLFGTYEGGLAIQADTGERFRVPYTWPFTNPNSLANIPVNRSFEFSIEIINLNLQVFNKLNIIVKKDLLISELWIHFYKYLESYFEFKPEMKVTDMLPLLIKEIESNKIERVGASKSNLNTLQQ